MVFGMMPGFVVGLLVGLVVVMFAAVWWVLVIRKRHGGGLPLPAFLIRAERPSPALRAVVSKVARSSAKDAIQEWDALPPGLKTAVRREVGYMVAETFARHSRYTRDGESST